MQYQLKEWFEYHNGHLIWKKPVQKIKVGDIAGNLQRPSRPKNKPYWKIGFQRKQYPAHRLIWIFHNGEIPEGMLCDHINGDSLDNRIENLRLVTQSGNNRNIKLPKNNKSGVCGVRWHSGAKRWLAAIKINQKEKHLGSFKEFDDAVKARISAEKKYNFETYQLNNRSSDE